MYLYESSYSNRRIDPDTVATIPTVYWKMEKNSNVPVFPGIPTEHIAIILSGYLTSDESGIHIIKADVDDIAIITINNDLCYNHTNGKSTCMVEFDAGVPQELVIKYFQDNDLMLLSLNWQKPTDISTCGHTHTHTDAHMSVIPPESYTYLYKSISNTINVKEKKRRTQDISLLEIKNEL